MFQCKVHSHRDTRNDVTDLPFPRLRWVLSRSFFRPLNAPFLLKWNRKWPFLSNITYIIDYESDMKSALMTSGVFDVCSTVIPRYIGSY